MGGGASEMMRGLWEQALDIARASFHQKGAERHRWRALVTGTSLVGMTRHASGDVQAGLASADSAQAMADHTDKRRDSLSQHQDAAIPCALHRIAALRFAMVCPRHPSPPPPTARKA